MYTYPVVRLDGMLVRLFVFAPRFIIKYGIKRTLGLQEKLPTCVARRSTRHEQRREGERETAERLRQDSQRMLVSGLEIGVATCRETRGLKKAADDQLSKDIDLCCVLLYFPL